MRRLHRFLNQRPNEAGHEPPATSRHREERSDVAIQPTLPKLDSVGRSPAFPQQDWIAALPRIKCGVARNDGIGVFIRPLVFAFLFFLAAFPIQAQAKEAPTFEPAHVVASFPILADMIREIGGEHVVVETLVAEGQDAHTFQPTPDDAKKLAGADIIAINGLKFELWMGRLIKASGSKAKLLVATAGLKPRVLETSDNGEITPDPHAWQDLGNAPIYIKNITAALIEAKPAYADFYKQRARNFLNECARVDGEIKESFAAIPPERRKVITSHDAFGYYGAAYGVTFLAPVGISTEEEPSAASLSKLIEQIKAEKVRALFVESMASPRLMQQIAEETGAKIGGTLYADTLTAADNEAATYLDLMRLNSSRLLAAMKD